MSTSAELTKYNPKAVGEFGNKFMVSLIAQAAMEQEAEEMKQGAEHAKQFIGFELTRALLDLAERFPNEVDLTAINGTAGDVRKLNRSILMHLGILKREIKGDEIVYEWTDKKVENLYSYTKELKEEDEAEYNRRFNNRKRLNQRMADAARISIGLIENKNVVADLTYEENEAGETVPALNNAPKAIAGNRKSVQLGSKKIVEGATLSPTLTSLVKLSKERFAKEKGKSGERADKGGDRAGNAKLGISDQVIGEQVNNLVKMINAQEGQFSAGAIKHFKTLQPVLDKAIKAGATKKK